MAYTVHHNPRRPDELDGEVGPFGTIGEARTYVYQNFSRCGACISRKPIGGGDSILVDDTRFDRHEYPATPCAVTDDAREYLDAVMNGEEDWA